MRTLAAAHEATVAQVALAWLLAKPGVRQRARRRDEDEPARGQPRCDPCRVIAGKAEDAKRRVAGARARRWSFRRSSARRSILPIPPDERPGVRRTRPIGACGLHLRTLPTTARQAGTSGGTSGGAYCKAVTSSRESDPVVEAYKKDVDRTLIRENLKLSVEERLAKMISVLGFVDEVRRSKKVAR